MNYIDNIIYQNLLFIIGDKFLTEWRNDSTAKRDFLKELKDYIYSLTGTNEFFYQLCSILYKTSDEKEHQKIESLFKEYMKELRKMQNKDKFFEEKKSKKETYIKRIKKIDIILKDEKLLVKEFEKYNYKSEEDKKIKTIKLYANMLKREKEMYTNEVKNISFLLEKSNFSKRKKELEFYEKILKDNRNIEENIIELEKEFLVILNRKANKLENREKIISAIYELRYIKNIPFKKGKLLFHIDNLNNGIDRIMKKIITNACKLGIIKIISMDINLNFEIIKYAIDTKIINLEQIKLNFDMQEDFLIIKVLDKEVFEKHGRKKINKSKDLLEVKLNKTIKLFC